MKLFELHSIWTERVCTPAHADTPPARWVTKKENQNGIGPRRRELRAAQRMATSVRIGRPSRAPQLTPAPLAITSPSSTARPGEKCWPASMRRSEEHTSELQSLRHIVCRLL